MLGWIVVLFGLLIFAYSMGYATRATISAMRRRRAAQFKWARGEADLPPAAPRRRIKVKMHAKGNREAPL
jgi:hypothetical protein